MTMASWRAYNIRIRAPRFSSGSQGRMTMTKSRASALSISRRKFMAGTGVAGAALASNLAAPGILAQTRAPIRLGNLNSLNGSIAN